LEKRKKKKGLEIWKNPRKILEGGGNGNFAGFPGFGRRRDFRDDGDGEVNRPAGPRRARDS
jgi:hypothetical protein